SYHITGSSFYAQVIPYTYPDQRILGDLAIALGFRWGGKFAKPDPVHFDDGRRTRPGLCAPRVRPRLRGDSASLLSALKRLGVPLSSSGSGERRGSGAESRSDGASRNGRELYQAGRY